MARPPSAAPQAVLLDALGTLLRLEPPAPRLLEELGSRGVEVTPAAAERAVAAEIAYYRANLHLGRTPDSLAGLRRRCAEVMGAELGEEALALGAGELTRILLASLVFTPFADAPPALARLRRLGLRLVVVSNWDCSLREVLERVGLGVHLDGAVASAELGAAKPDPLPFRRGLALAGVEADRAWHVGDQVDADVAGARNAGVEPVLVDRWDGGAPEGVRSVRALTELPALLA
jgi:putative hydrolase of the HAD superfamily